MEKISISNLNKEINYQLKLYSDNIAKDIKIATDECMEEFTKKTREDAPRGKRKKFYKNIKWKTFQENTKGKTNIWYVTKPEYRLTHLIKNGHALKKGGRTKGNDFISSNYESIEKKYVERIEKITKNGY